MWWQEFLSDGARWLVAFLAAYVLIPLKRMWDRNKQEKKDLVAKVDKLETQFTGINEKLDTEILERRAMETKLDKIDDKIDHKFDKLTDVLNKVVTDTALNAERIKK